MAQAQATTGSSRDRDQTGLITCVLHFIIQRGDIAEDDEPWDDLDNFSPAKPPPFTEETSRRSAKRDDGDWDLFITFQGGDESKFRIILEIDHAGSEDPIESFGKFALLKKFYGADVDEHNRLLGWKLEIKDPQTGKMAPNPFLGTTHFLNDSCIVRFTFNLRKFDIRWLKNMAKKETPPLSNMGGKLTDDDVKAITQPPDGKSFIKRSVKIGFRGAVWQYSLEYLLGKPVPVVYDVPAS
jgi:hypothetical protein